MHPARMSLLTVGLLLAASTTEIITGDLSTGPAAPVLVDLAFVRGGL